MSLEDDELATLKFRIYRDGQSLWWWRLSAPNRGSIANCSQGFENRAECEREIDLVKAAAARAYVVEESM